jgi:hypothetical protein
MFKRKEEAKNEHRFDEYTEMKLNTMQDLYAFLHYLANNEPI